jgi:cation:H+ antiporter
MSVSGWISNLVFFFLGFALLTIGAEFLVRGASRLAARMKVSSVVIGLTIVAFGTSLPELLVSVVANLEGGGDIAIGNIVGSNIANLGLILGVAAAMSIVNIERHLLRRELPLLAGTSVLFIVLSWNGRLGLVEGLILSAGLLAFTYVSYTSARTSPIQQQESESALEAAESFDAGIGQASTRPLRDIGFILIGLMGLIIGADWLVNAAESIARAVGVSELVIGLTLVAIGTSLPELATTLAAVRKGEADLAVGNVVGSNLFNMLFIGGVSAIVRPLTVPPEVLRVDYWVMLGFTLAVLIAALPKPHRLYRWEGALLLLGYAGYTAWLFIK